MKSPAPDNYIMSLADFYSADTGPEIWYNKLVTWLPVKGWGWYGSWSIGVGILQY